MVQVAQLGEKGLLQFIVRDLQHFSNAFGFMETTAIGGYLPDWTIDCHLSVKCEHLGLVPIAKPGDVDVLLVPVFDGDPFVERSIAIEAKRFIVPKDKRGRSPSSFGVSQVCGLMDYGFPFVGLLHVPIVEHSDAKDWVDIPVHKTRYREGEAPFDGTLSIDPAVQTTTSRHVGRFKSFSLPDCVGYNVHTLQLSRNGQAVVGWSVWGWRAPQKNPYRNADLLERLRQFDRTPDFRVHRHLGGGEVVWTGAHDIEY